MKKHIHDFQFIEKISYYYMLSQKAEPEDIAPPGGYKFMCICGASKVIQEKYNKI